MLWKQQLNFDISALNIFKYFKADKHMKSLVYVIFNTIFLHFLVRKYAAVACMGVESVAEQSNMIGLF